MVVDSVWISNVLKIKDNKIFYIITITILMKKIYTFLLNNFIKIINLNNIKEEIYNLKVIYNDYSKITWLYFDWKLLSIKSNELKIYDLNTLKEVYSKEMK